MNLLLKTLTTSAIVATLAVPALAQDDKTITIGTMGWEDLTPIAGHVWMPIDNLAMLNEPSQ